MYMHSRVHRSPSPLPSCRCSCEATCSIGLDRLLLKSHNCDIYNISRATFSQRAIARRQVTTLAFLRSRTYAHGCLFTSGLCNRRSYNARGSNRNTALHYANLVLSGAPARPARIAKRDTRSLTREHSRHKHVL